jgi:hypothetical protein
MSSAPSYWRNYFGSSIRSAVFLLVSHCTLGRRFLPILTDPHELIMMANIWEDIQISPGNDGGEGHPRIRNDGISSAKRSDYTPRSKIRIWKLLHPLAESTWPPPPVA